MSQILPSQVYDICKKCINCYENDGILDCLSGASFIIKYDGPKVIGFEKLKRTHCPFDKQLREYHIKQKIKKLIR